MKPIMFLQKNLKWKVKDLPSQFMSVVEKKNLQVIKSLMKFD